MDRRHLEPRSWLRQDQPRLQALLCRNVCRTLSWCQGASLRAGFDLRLVPEKLTEPFTWRSPKLVFVNSMSDLFQTGVPDDYAEAVASVMATANWHTYQVLTKRSERLLQLLKGRLRFAAEQENIWWGVSVEDRKHGLPRVDHLRQAPAKVRFLSIEPLLEDLGEIDLSGITWVIVGGESGPGARPMKREWVVSIRKQCRMQGVPFFFKQWGGVRKAKNGRLLDGRTYDEYPVRAALPVPDRATCLSFAETVKATLDRFVQQPLVQLTA
jgi:protein gp37